MTMIDADPIDDYLDRLLAQLRGRARDVRRILAEVEDHLRDAVAEGEAEGLSPADARARALSRFGSPTTVARRFARRPRRLAPVPVLGQVVLALALVAGIGLAGIGLSGAAAWGMGQVWGKGFVAGDVAGVTYTPARCADFREYHPEARTCEEAAAAHHFDEVVTYRLAAGILGLLTLGAWALARRSPRAARMLGTADGVGLLPEGFTATIGTVLFGVVAAGTLVQAGGQLAGGYSAGAGEWLSGGLVSAAIGLAFLVGLHRVLAERGLTGDAGGLEVSPGA